MEIWFLDIPADAQRVKWAAGVDVETIYCPVRPGHQRAGARIQDLSVVLPTGPLADFLWTWPRELLIHQEALDLFSAAGITGFVTRPVRSRFAGRNEGKSPELSEMVITGWGGIAPPQSGIILDAGRSCRACGLLVYSSFTDAERLFDESQWDGSDMFMIWPLPRYPFVTERVVDLITRHELTGIEARPIGELRSPMGHLSPGRLHRWIPKERLTMNAELWDIY